jgi:uncharacterized protein YcbX
MIKINHLVTYPIKSCKGIPLQNSMVSKRGLNYDRQWTIIDTNGQAITGRENQSLLKITPNLESQHLCISAGSKEIKVELIPEIGNEQVKIFSNQVEGSLYNSEVNDFLSEYLNQDVRLVYMDKSYTRSVKEKHKGEIGDEIAYADAAPILLVSEKSMEELNSRLTNKVSWLNFRPNIVINGDLPYSEDNWNRVSIGACEFKSASLCSRCVFTTIDPVTGIKDPNGEPLKTLATYRTLRKKGVLFGLYLIPKKLGEIKVGDYLGIRY